MDTNIIPDRNVGIASLLWDLQNPQNPDRDGPPLLAPEFAFIDVGVSRAKVATALETLLARDLKMDVDYVATERIEAVPYASVTLLGDRAEKIRGCLSAIFSSKGATCEVKDWHFVVDQQGKVASIAYRYDLHGNEIWEAYFMGRTFMYSGEQVEFSNPELDEALAADVAEIEARIDLERKRDGDPSQPAPSWDGYRMEKNPLEAGLAESGITLQKTDVPQRIVGKQNVLFLGNVLNHYPQTEQAGELHRICALLEHGDLVIIQTDEVATPSIEVLQLRGQGDRKRLLRVRWINTKTLEVHLPAPGPEGWRKIGLKPEVIGAANRMLEQLGENEGVSQSHGETRQRMIRQYFHHVFATYFRAAPVPAILRIATREALRRLPFEGGPKGIPVFKNEAKDAHAGALGLDPSPTLSEAYSISRRSCFSCDR
ncbi:MAG: hypothetical protein KJ070_21220 [Verrucomicrobia bacterium]|nr:hypothetical protein [Verrucomicrobiota bacterium]